MMNTPTISFIHRNKREHNVSFHSLTKVNRGTKAQKQGQDLTTLKATRKAKNPNINIKPKKIELH